MMGVAGRKKLMNSVLGLHAVHNIMASLPQASPSCCHIEEGEEKEGMKEQNGTRLQDSGHMEFTRERWSL